MTKGDYRLRNRFEMILILCRKPAEYMAISDTYSPILHRIDQAVRWRAIHPIDSIPPPYEILTRYSQFPKKLVASSKRQLEDLVAAANVKKGIFIMRIYSSSPNSTVS